MAQRVRTQLLDDLDGGEAHETVTFGLDRQLLEIDLSKDNADRLRDSLAEFVKAARKVGGRRKRARVTARSGGAARTDHPTTTGQVTKPRAVPAVTFSSPPTTAADAGEPPTRPTPATFAAEVRQWAKAQGLGVSSHGRIAQKVIEAYQSRTDPKPKARTKKVG